MRPDHIECAGCIKDSSSHYLHVVGMDRLGRPVLFSSFALMGSRSVAGLIEHMVVEFERAVRLMSKGVETWVWLNGGWPATKTFKHPHACDNMLYLSIAG